MKGSVIFLRSVIIIHTFRLCTYATLQFYLTLIQVHEMRIKINFTIYDKI